LLLASVAAGAPVIIHLLNRHRPRTIEWGAMELLRRVTRIRARQIRLQDILLMLLRCLAILLLVLALSRPTLRSSAPVSGADVGVLVAIDNSASMGHKPGLQSRLDQAKQRAREVFSTLAPGRPVTLVSAANGTEILLRNVGFDAQRFNQALESIEPSGEALNPERALEELAPMAQELEAPQREVYLISDAQAWQWAQPSRRLAAQVRQYRDDSKFSLVVAEPKGDDNAAVTDVRFAGGALQLGALARFDARVANLSSSRMDVGELHLLVNGQEVDRSYVGTLDPGGAMVVPLRVNWQQDGPARVVVRLDHDALPADNSRYLTVNVQRSARVLIVDGGSSKPSEPSAAHYLATALSPRAQSVARLPIETETVSWLALPNTNLGQYDVILLANVPDLSAAKVEELFDFVRRGGGVMAFMGDNVKVDAWNRKMWQGEEFLLPARLAGAVDVGGVDSSLPLDPEIPAHPLLGPLRTLRAERLTAARFNRIMQVEPIEAGRALLHLAAGGQPLLLQRDLGMGRVLLMTSTADRSWNNLPLNPVLPLLVQQSITYLSRRPFEQGFAIGEPIVLPLDLPDKPAEIVITDPTGQERTVQAETREGRFLVDMGQARAAGFYVARFEPTGREIPVAVNMNPAESDVRTAAASELRSSLEAGDVRVAGPGANLAQTIRETRVGKELWMYFLLAAIAVTVLEAILARVWTRRKIQPTEPSAARRSEQQVGQAA
jgi:hypothetical protein